MKKYFIKSLLAFGLFFSLGLSNHALAAVEIIKTDGFSNGAALVAGADDITVLEFVLENTELNDVEITQIDIKAVGSSADFTNYISAPFVTGGQVNSPKSLAIDGSASFDSLSNNIIPAGTNKEFVIIIDTIAAAANDDISFTVTNISADNPFNGNPVDITDDGSVLGATVNEILTGTDENCDGDTIDTNVTNSLCGSSFELLAPIELTEVTPVPDFTNDKTPDYVFNSTGTGTVTYAGGCTSATSDIVPGDNTITFDTLLNQSYTGCTISASDEFGLSSDILTVSSFIVDENEPTLYEKVVVPAFTNDNTPDYIFQLIDAVIIGETHVISYGGSCSSADTNAIISNNNIITLNTLADGTYSDCTITVTDRAGNVSSALAIQEFTVDTTQPNVTVEQKAGQTDPATTDSASFTITFDEAIDATTFDASDLTITGSGTVLSGPIQISPNVFEVTLNGLLNGGTTSVSVPANSVEDLAGNLNTASTSTDNSVTYQVATNTYTSRYRGLGGGGRSIRVTPTVQYSSSNSMKLR